MSLVENEHLGYERLEFFENIIAPETRNPIVRKAFQKVDRRDFVPHDQRHNAYKDMVIRIQDGSSVSQPSLVAKMVDFLNPNLASNRILQVGTGSGYLSAVLSHCYQKVYTIEYDSELAQNAEERLSNLGYSNINIKSGDGAEGWKNHAPFDAIIVSASTKKVLQPFIDQLNPTGKIVIPVGPRSPYEAKLIFGEKQLDGSLTTQPIGSVGFVPLVSQNEGCWTQLEIMRLIAELGQEVTSKLNSAAAIFGPTQEGLIPVFREKYGYDIPDEDLIELILREREVEILKTLLLP